MNDELWKDIKEGFERVGTTVRRKRSFPEKFFKKQSHKSKTLVLTESFIWYRACVWRLANKSDTLYKLPDYAGGDSTRGEQ